MTSGQLLEQRARDFAAEAYRVGYWDGCDDRRERNASKEAASEGLAQFFADHANELAALTPLPGDDLELVEAVARARPLLDATRKANRPIENRERLVGFVLPEEVAGLSDGLFMLDALIALANAAITSFRVIGGEQEGGVGDGLRPQPATHEPGLASRPGPAGECQAQEGAIPGRGTSPPPEGYELLPKGVRCRCLHMWQNAAGYWCRQCGERIAV